MKVITEYSTESTKEGLEAEELEQDVLYLAFDKRTHERKGVAFVCGPAIVYISDDGTTGFDFRTPLKFTYFTASQEITVTLWNP